MKRACYVVLGILVGNLQWVSAEEPFAWNTLAKETSEVLSSGEAVVLPCRPDEVGKEDIDSRFVSVAKLISGSRERIWEVIHDKEDAEHFLDGVLESRVLEESEKEIIVEQRTHVGGPKGDYLYQLRHRLTPHTRSDFTYIKGEIRNVIGTWWIFDGPSADRHLVVYSLHIDPGVFAPQFVVKRGMKKSMPGTILSIQREVQSRAEKDAEAAEQPGNQN